MTMINPWINFNGNAEEAFTFYRSIFGGEFTEIIRFKDLESSEFPASDTEAEKIMRITLPIGTSGMLVGNNSSSYMGKVNENENRSKVLVQTETKEEAFTIFKNLSAGGQVEVPLNEESDTANFAMFRDKYGIEWVIECIATK